MLNTRVPCGIKKFIISNFIHFELNSIIYFKRLRKFHIEEKFTIILSKVFIYVVNSLTYTTYMTIEVDGFRLASNKIKLDIKVIVYLLMKYLMNK